MENLKLGQLSHQWTMPGDNAQKVLVALTVAEIKFLTNDLINYHNESLASGQYCTITAGLLEKFSKDANLELEAK